jgi:hypothetical protein
MQFFAAVRFFRDHRWPELCWGYIDSEAGGIGLKDSRDLKNSRLGVASRKFDPTVGADAWLRRIVDLSNCRVCGPPTVKFCDEARWRSRLALPVLNSRERLMTRGGGAVQPKLNRGSASMRGDRTSETLLARFWTAHDARPGPASNF